MRKPDTKLGWWSFVLWGVFSFALTGCARAGSAGIGDPYYANLGNGGYDVSHYTISLSVNPELNEINGSTTIDGQATQTLRSLNLDFQGLTVDSVQVDSDAADFSLQDHELTITPGKPLKKGSLFSILVAYHGNPQPLKNIVSSDEFDEVGWFHNSSGAIAVWSEPNGAASWFPTNDHPRDKATYRFEISVPKPWVVAASGKLVEVVDVGDQTRFIYEMGKPMASYMATIDIDRYTIETYTIPGGVTIRNYLTPDFPEDMKVNIDKLPEMMAYFSSLFVPYPFDEYGVVVLEEDMYLCEKAGGQGLATESQTLSLFCPDFALRDESIMAHELAHMWFGDYVSLENWQDIWLKEGLATYAEWLWAHRDQSLEEFTQFVENEASHFWTAKIGLPPADNLYRNEVYKGGAITMHALRLRVGDEVFFKILRTYLERYQYANASTDEFIDVAEEVSGQKLSAFFKSWLMETDLPDLPELAK